MNAALQTSEARFRGLFENAVIGMVLVDRTGTEVQANRAMLELLGLDEHEQVKHTDALSVVVDAAHTAPRAERSVTCPDGRERLLQITTTEIPKAPNSAPYTALFVEDVTDLRQFQRDLEDRQRALRALFVNEETIREHERTALSRDIHDVLGQMLTAHKMDLHWLKSRGSVEEAGSSFDEMLEHVDEMIAFVKRVCSQLRDSVLDDFGFEVALDEHLRQFQDRSGVSVDFHNACNECGLPRDLAVSLLRIIQEALTNIARHAQASRVEIGCIAKDERILWTIRDDGIGFDGSSVDTTKSLGLVGMNERAASWGGTVDIDSAPGEGTTVRVTVPIASLDEGAASSAAGDGA
jgi:signal transduction histidine kinase